MAGRRAAIAVGAKRKMVRSGPSLRDTAPHRLECGVDCFIRSTQDDLPAVAVNVDVRARLVPQRLDVSAMPSDERPAVARRDS